MRSMDTTEEYFELEREAHALRLAWLVGLIVVCAVCAGRCGW